MRRYSDVGLFESQERRTERLLQQALEGLLKRVSALSESDPDWKAANEQTHGAWLIGGFFAARGIVIVNPSKSLLEVWRKGDATKARALLEVLTLPMVSRWYWMIDRQSNHPFETRRLAREVAAMSVLSLFGHRSNDAVADFMDMDAQYDHELERLERDGTARYYECVLVLARAIEACGGPAIRWPRGTLPVDDVRELCEVLTQPPPLDIFEHMRIGGVLTTSFEAMVEYFKSVSAA